MSSARVTALVVLAMAVIVAACSTTTPLQPGNRAPVVQSLMVFPTTIGPSDSAVVVCVATDEDGDTLVYDWTSDCRIVKQGGESQFTLYHQFDGSLVVYPGPATCVNGPLDTGWVHCHVRDRRGGGAEAGVVRIILQQ